MFQLSLHLGKFLEDARKAQHLTQAELATRTGFSIPTIRLLERSRGNLASWQKAVSALDLVLKGRNLPVADTVGKQIAILRKQRGISQRAFSKMVGITPSTLVQLEKRSRGRVSTLERALVVLGAGGRLVPQNRRTSFFTGPGNSSVYHGWETPKWVSSALCTALGGAFDLDPCSPTHDVRKAPIHAQVHFTIEDNGLELPWFGRVFLNPPYGRDLCKWTSKAKAEVEVGNAKVVIGLVPARPDTTYWHLDVAEHATVFFLRGRLHFGGSEQAAPFPSALIVWGGTPTEIDAIGTAFPDAWRI